MFCVLVAYISTIVVCKCCKSYLALDSHFEIFSKVIISCQKNRVISHDIKSWYLVMAITIEINYQTDWKVCHINCFLELQPYVYSYNFHWLIK
jgi:hypothetical protein